MLLPGLLLSLAAAQEPPSLEPPAVGSASYRIGGGDVLQVVVYGEPSLSGPFPVDATGEMDFPLLGRVAVAGLTTTETTAALREQLMPDYLVSPSITVSVATYRSQPVQVLGAVAKPGLYYLRGPTSVMQILSEAGGVNPQGVDEVRVTHGREGEPTVLAYDRLLKGAEEASLAGGDIVFVPESLVSVTGSVAEPGEIAFREGLTLTQCIASVSGALSTAAIGRVYILRGDRRIRVNLRKILGGTAPDMVLQAGDRIHVPESVF